MSDQSAVSVQSPEVGSPAIAPVPVGSYVADERGVVFEVVSQSPDTVQGASRQRWFHGLVPVVRVPGEAELFSSYMSAKAGYVYAEPPADWSEDEALEHARANIHQVTTAAHRLALLHHAERWAELFAQRDAAGCHDDESVAAEEEGSWQAWVDVVDDAGLHSSRFDPRGVNLPIEILDARR